MSARVSSGSGSRQDQSTPDIFIRAVEKRFGPIAFDLAAHSGNAKHTQYYAPKDFLRTNGEPKAIDVDGKKSPNPVYREWREINDDPKALAFDSLAQQWHRIDGLLWLNPEFADITPWAEKCAEEMSRGAGAEIVMLVPAAVGANWFRDYVAPCAQTYFLNGRLCFDGKNLFPKDCLLAHFKPATRPTNRIWNGKTDRLSPGFVGEP